MGRADAHHRAPGTGVVEHLVRDRDDVAVAGADGVQVNPLVAQDLGAGRGVAKTLPIAILEHRFADRPHPRTVPNLLERLIALSEEDLTSALDEACAAGILQELRTPEDHYRFTHVLTQETLYAQWSASERARWHGRTGEALEALAASDPSLPPAEFAAWLGAFLPELTLDGSPGWLRPAVVTDKADGHLAHLDGLNLSRAWMLEGIAASALLAGIRGRPGVDRESIIDIILRVSRLFTDHALIGELDLNPVMVFPAPATPAVVDVRVKIAR